MTSAVSSGVSSFFVDLPQGVIDTLRAGREMVTGIGVDNTAEVVLKSAYDEIAHQNETLNPSSPVLSMKTVMKLGSFLTTS